MASIPDTWYGAISGKANGYFNTVLLDAGSNDILSNKGKPGPCRLTHCVLVGL